MSFSPTIVFSTAHDLYRAAGSSMSCLQLCVLLSLFCSNDQALFAIDEVTDESEAVPGLLTTISDGTYRVQRLDRRVSFDWTGTPADSRLNDDQEVEWSGRLLVRLQGPHRFHATIGGRVTIEIDGKVVLTADGDNLFVSGESIDLSNGDHEFIVKYRSQLNVDPKLQLFWSSPLFTLEPLPADVLSSSLLEAESPNAVDVRSALKAEHGRAMVDALRCSACHAGLDELPTLKAPSLAKLSSNSTADIVVRLMNPSSVNPHTAMPSFGLSEQNARDIAAFLLQNAETPKLTKVPRFKDGDVDAGSKLLLTTGCVTCHVVPTDSNVMPTSAYAGPDLTTVGKRRAADWLATWLKNPEKLNPDHRMPLFELSDDERRQLVAALLATSSAGESKQSEEAESGDAAAGKKLVIESNCRSCHHVPNIEPAARIAKPEWNESSKEKLSCVVTEPVAEINATIPLRDKEIRQPQFVRTAADRKSMAMWIQSSRQPLRPVDHSVKGDLLLHRHGCIACHDRDQQRGISAVAASIESLRDDLRGQSQALIPPALTAVGD